MSLLLLFAGGGGPVAPAVEVFGIRRMYVSVNGRMMHVMPPR